MPRFVIEYEETSIRRCTVTGTSVEDVRNRYDHRDDDLLLELCDGVEIDGGFGEVGSIKEVGP